MTKKDFERIAQVFRVNKPSRSSEDGGYAAKDMWYALIDDMCVELQAINPRFNEETFIKACNQ